MSFRSALLSAGTVSAIFLCGCSSKSDLPDVEVSGAIDAVNVITNYSATKALSYRPSSLIGIYTSMFYANGLAIPVASARSGIEAQMKLNGKPSEESLSNTYALLEEFGTILQINIPDLLDRSTDRAQTLNEYTQGLANITTRAERRQAETTQYLATLRTSQRDLKNKLNTANRTASKAVNDGDFAGASKAKEEASVLQVQVSKNDADQKEFTQLGQYFKKLLDVAHARQKAINENREVLIAGLKVVDVPGADTIGVLQPANRRSGGSTTANPFNGM